MNIIRKTSSVYDKCFSLINMRTIKRLINKCFSLTGVRTIKRPVNKCYKDLAFKKRQGHNFGIGAKVEYKSRKILFYKR